MRDLLIAGTGIHSMEMAEIVERINAVSPTWNLLGFLSTGTEDAGAVRNGYPVVGGPEALTRFSSTCIVPDNEWPRALTLPRDRMVSLVDPSVFMSRTARIGVGCVLYPNCFVGLNARVGDLVFCLCGCTINHDDVLEDRIVLASGVTLAGSVHVEADCYLGQSCSVRQQLRIGHGSIIGMGAVIIRSVSPESVIVGNPGRILRRCDV